MKFTLSYSAATKNKTAVQKYIDWLTQPAQQKSIADELGVPVGQLSADGMTGSYAPLKQLVAEDKVIPTPGETWPAPVLAALQQDTPACSRVRRRSTRSSPTWMRPGSSTSEQRGAVTTVTAPHDRPREGA